MGFSFEVEKPANVEKTLERLKNEIIDSGGALRGNEKSGHISSDGVEGSYKVFADHIMITVIKKPLLYPEAAVEQYIRSEFRKASK